MHVDVFFEELASSVVFAGEVSNMRRRFLFLWVCRLQFACNHLIN